MKAFAAKEFAMFSLWLSISKHDPKFLKSAKHSKYNHYSHKRGTGREMKKQCVAWMGRGRPMLELPNANMCHSLLCIGVGDSKHNKGSQGVWLGTRATCMHLMCLCHNHTPLEQVVLEILEEITKEICVGARISNMKM